MGLTTSSGLDDRNGSNGLELIECFDAWLSERLAEARGAGKDLAFFDSELRRTPDGRLTGWTHLLLDPGSNPPLGESWTVYRLD
jgi:hypothetical protein